MGSGREGGSPSSATMSAAAPKQAFASSSSALSHKMEREELLDGGSNAASANLVGGKGSANLSGRFRTPRGGNTPLHSPRSMSPLRGLSSTEIASSEIASATLVDFQDAILRASSAQKTILRADSYAAQEDPMDFQIRKPLMQTEDSAMEAAMAARNKSEPAHAQEGEQQARRSKSPFPCIRSRDLLEDVNQQTVARNSKVPSEWVILDKRRSPRRSKASSSVAMETDELRMERKSSRSTSRKSKVEPVQELPDADLGMGDANRAARRTHARPHTRQHKRKASESVTVIAGGSPPPDSFDPHVVPSARHSQQQIAEYQVPPYRGESHVPATSFPVSLSSRRASREARVVQTSDWLQFIVDVIMWRHVPRSALLFGLGCFCIMSASMIKDMQCSTFSVAAYMALFYLAARFIRCNFLRGSQSTLSFRLVTEGDALRLIRIILPPLNLMLQELGDLFSGEPVVTLKVAGALWFLARAASMMNFWSLVRIAFFALFTVPRCYSSYHNQIESQVRNVSDWIYSTWIACSHKKAVLVVGFLLSWNLSSVSTRVCGAFLLLVGVRAYRHSIQVELDSGSAFFGQERHLREGN